MAFQVSPGVNVSEVDLTTVVPSVSTSIGGYAADFRWGPVEYPVQVTNENELVTRFGKPNTDTYVSFYTAANFLSYSNDLRIVRAANTASYTAVANAVSGGIFTGTPVQIKNEDAYDAGNYGSLSSVAGAAFAARYPGALGNSLKVEVFASSNTADWAAWEYSNLFDNIPGTSPYFAESLGVVDVADEMHIVVVDEDGMFTGVPGTVLEKYTGVSKATNAKDESGTNLYYRDVILNRSKYVYVVGHPSGASNWGADVDVDSDPFDELDTTATSYSMTGGADQPVTDGALQLAWDILADAERIDVSLLMAGGASATVAEYIVGIAESRRDCVVFMSPPLVDTQSANPTDDIVDYRKTDLDIASSFAFMDSGWKYQYDKYNDIYRWVPLNGDVAGLAARTDNVRDPWFSPAGLTRGQIKNVVKLSYNPNKANRDELYKADINPVVSFPGEGTVLFGDKTMLGRPSAFDRINVRRLFIVLEKAIARAARSSLFEFNDEFTRAQFVSIVEPFLRTVKGRRGVYDYKVVCDATNNTSDVVDRNEFVGDIYIKPAKSINFIQLNFVAVRSGVAFDEIVGKF